MHTIECQLCIQKLNEQGCFYLEIGLSQLAVDAYSEAIVLANHCFPIAGKNCSCDKCSLYSCMEYTNSCTSSNMERQRFRSEKIDNGFFLFRKPIRISAEAVAGHEMRATISLVLTFNLAVASHLNLLLNTTVNTRGDIQFYEKRFQGVLELYQYAYRWQRSMDKATVVRAPNFWRLRFEMIVANNIGDIHIRVGNFAKYRTCMEHLLSTIMLTVDTRQLCSSSSSQNTSNPTPASSTLSTLSSSADIEEGLMRNALSLVLACNAAEAA